MSRSPAIPTLGLIVAGMMAAGLAGAAPASASPRHGEASPLREHQRLHRHRSALLPQPQAVFAAPSTVPPGGYVNDQVNNGSFSQFAPNDPERPFGAYSTVTAPTGTIAAQEQENNRRYYCNFAPEHC